MDKKNLIIKKALKLFAERGTEATSIQQITDYCGISKGAFYLHFKSKDELIISLIEQFSKQIIYDIDQSVINHTNSKDVLYVFYKTALQSLEKNISFTKIFVKEQNHSFNNQLLNIISKFERLMKKNIYDLLNQVYGTKIEKNKYDLTYCMYGLITIYSKLFLVYKIPVDFEKLAHSLVEMTDILAHHVKNPYLNFDIDEFMNGKFEIDISSKQLTYLIEEALDSMISNKGREIEEESLQLLHKHLKGEQTLANAIIKGLYENIRQQQEYKELSYLLRIYFKF
ncbi:putative transcriptional regulator [Bacillus sp. TS-2]|nr:putative transcriptional regulator [Bacillus sp. TS-2]